jgi:hypothetical protein
MTDMTLRREIPVRVRARDADYPDTRHMRHRGMARFHNHDALFPRWRVRVAFSRCKSLG